MNQIQPPLQPVRSTRPRPSNPLDRAIGRSSDTFLDDLWLLLSGDGISRYDADGFGERDQRRIARIADFVERIVIPYHRADMCGIARIPQGPGLYVGNHNAGMLTIDSFIFAAVVLQARGMIDLPFFLTHDLVVGNPILNQVLAPLGVVRACSENAERLFQGGYKVFDYPGGEIDAWRPYRKRDRIHFDGRRGYLRLALRNDVPIIPVVTAGAHSTFLVIDDLPWLARLLRVDKLWRIKRWPLILSLPWGLTLGPAPPHLPLPTRIRIEILDPIRFERSGKEAAEDRHYVDTCARRVEETMQRSLSQLSMQCRSQ